MESNRESTQHAMILVDQGPSFKFESKTVPLPDIGPLDVLVKLSVTGLCHSDVSLALGDFGPCTPILGHEGVGRIVELGSAIQASQGIVIGSRVGVGWLHDTCGSCQTCLSENGQRFCPSQRDHARDIGGTFADFVIISSSLVHVLPEGPPDELLAPMLCGGLTAYRALKECGAHAGQWVVLVGAGGGLGSLGVEFARIMGFRVIAIDTGEEKGNAVVESGAEFYIDFLVSNPAERVLEITEGSRAAAVVVFAGSSRAYSSAMDMLGFLSTMVAIGVPPLDERLSIHPINLISKGAKIVGSIYSRYSRGSEGGCCLRRERLGKTKGRHQAN